MNGSAAPLDDKTREALVGFLLGWADDELVLGHRDSEWTGFAPQIEEDVAFSSIAQDELGHAALLYRLAAELTGDNVDRLALRRPAHEYRHAALLERPNGDWAFAIARHYLYDLADAGRTAAASESAYAPLAAIARKMVREEHYHQMHDAAWWERLRDGTPESHERLVVAVRDMAPLAGAVLGEMDGAGTLEATGILTRSWRDLYAEWRAQVAPLLRGLDPALLALVAEAPPARQTRPVSDDFRRLHAEMTMVSTSGLGERW